MKITEILGTGYMDKSFKNEKDFFAKYFTRPFLTRKARKDRPIRVKVNKLIHMTITIIVFVSKMRSQRQKLYAKTRV